VFKSLRGSTPKISGKGIANPTAMMLSSVLMLMHLNEPQAAERLQQAVEQVYAGGKHTTPDVGGTASTGEFTDAVIAAMR
jgi:isocitrate dehydrogenase (NAD+)